MKATVYLSRKLLNQLKVKETESKDLMDETKTATKAQVNTIFDYISKFNRYDMNVSKVMAD